MYDLIIVGAGPIGLTLGIEAKKAGLDCLLLEKGALVDSIYRFPTNMTFFSTSRLLEIREVPFISHGDKPTRREALEYYRRVQERWRLQIHNYEAVTSVQKEGDTGAFTVTTHRSVYRSTYVALATGFYGHARRMNIPGEELEHVLHYYDEPHPYIGQRVVVIGAANSACDVALELFQKGADVTMIIRGSEISDRVKYWIRPNIINRIKEGSIRAFFNAQPLHIDMDRVQIDHDGEVVSVPASWVLAMTGYRPDLDFIQAAGVELIDDETQRPQYDPDTHESNVPGLYIAGVLCGGLHTSTWFIENARAHAPKIIRSILSTP